MKKNSTLLLGLMFSFAGSTVVMAQVDPKTDSIATDSIDYTADVQLQETVIVGKGIIDLEEDRKTPVAVSTITKYEIQDKAVGNVEFPEILKHTPSVYVTGQPGGFGDGKMFLRGFDQSNTAYLLNGQPINGMEDGNMYWSNWSSLTDVANLIQVQRGLGSSKLAISSVGGTVNIVTKTTEKREGGMARFVMGNDSYMKGTVSYDTGLKGKWGFSMMLDYWSGHRKFAQGTAGEGQSYFFSIGYKPSERHDLNLMIFGAPQWHDQNYSTKSEKQWANGNYDRKYNSTYGYFNGEGLNFRRNYYHKPVVNLNWDWIINNQASLSTVVYASLGRGGATGNLGSSANTTNLLTENGMIDFDQIWANNQEDILNGDGIGNTGGGFKNGGMRTSVNNHFWYGAVTNFKYDLNANWKFNVGADVRFYQGDHFRQLNNLLGLNGWQDTKGFDGAQSFVANETFEADPWSALFNNAKDGQRLNYDNSEKINYQGGFGQIEYNVGGFSAFVQGAVSNQSYVKIDRWNYATETESDVVNKLGYNIKGGLAYDFDGVNTVFANAGFYSRQPYLDNIFVSNSVDIRKPEIDNEEITGYEFGYRYNTRNLKVNINLYQTEWANRFESFSSREDANYDGLDVAYLLTNVTQIHRGVEVDFMAKPARKWTVRGYASYGDWKFEGDTPAEVRDNDSYDIIDQTHVSLEGLQVGTAAQFTLGFGTAFEITRGLSVDTDFNFYGNIYEDPNIAQSIINKEYKQDKLDAYGLVDLGLTYEFKFGTQAVKFRGNVKNLFNSQYIIAQDGNGYGWGNGRTWNAGIQYNF